MKSKLLSLISLVLVLLLLSGCSGLSKKDDLPPDAPRINGVHLEEFTIIYSKKDTDFSARAAEYIQKEIKDRVPVNGVYWFKTNSKAVCRWLIGGTMRIIKILSDDEVKTINDKVGLKDLPRLEELKQ